MIIRNSKYIEFVNELYNDDSRLIRILSSEDFYQDEKLLEAEKVYRIGKLSEYVRTVNYNLVEIIQDVL